MTMVTFYARCTPTGACGVEVETSPEVYRVVGWGFRGVSIPHGALRERVWNPETRYTHADVRAGTPGANFRGGELTHAEAASLLDAAIAATPAWQEATAREQTAARAWMREHLDV